MVASQTRDHARAARAAPGAPHNPSGQAFAVLVNAAAATPTGPPLA
jgi:hypothetical protein